MMNPFFTRIFALICALFAIALFSMDRPSEFSEPETRKVTYASLRAEVGESYVVLQEFGNLRVRFHEGRGLVEPRSDYPDDAELSVIILPIIAQADGVRDTEGKARKYVFSVATVSLVGSELASMLLVFEDNGKKLAFVGSARLGERVFVSGISASPLADEHRGELGILVRVAVPDMGDGVGAPPTLPQEIQLRMRESDGTLMRDSEAIVAPPVSPPAPYVGQ